MNKKTTSYLLGLFIIFNYSAFGQNVKSVSATEQIHFTPNLSLDDATKICVKETQIKALENEFGRVIIEGNSTYIENSDGKRLETTTIFHSVGESYVNGEWLETTSKECEEIKAENGEKWLRCTIKGKAREIPEDKIEFEAITLDCNEKSCRTESFVSDEDLFLYFKTPEKGFLSVYLTDQNEAYCLLPYEKMSRASLPVKADKEYILFSSINPDFINDEKTIDEYQLYTDKKKEMNRIFIIFSPTRLTKPILNSNDTEDIKLPKNMESEKFIKWLNKLRVKNKNVVVKSIDVLITNKK